MARDYLPRLMDQLLQDAMAANGAVWLQGAKWCGKTTTAARLAGSVLYMQDPRTKEQNIRMAQLDPGLLLAGETPRLIDEWQLAPALWDAVRFEVDQRDNFNQFILTGSTLPELDWTRTHSGTGRIARVVMRPMTLFESGDSSGTVSLGGLFRHRQSLAVQSQVDIHQLAYVICRGGWPRAQGQTERIALRQAFDYYDAVAEADISQADGVTRNPHRVKRLMRSYARHIATDAKITNIHRDMLANETDTLSVDTINAYINALKRIFVIEDMPAWNPNLRSATAIRTSDTRHFVDPSIAAAALGFGPEDLINDLNTMGLMFESMCVRDLRVYADALDGEVYHYRDKLGLECDAVVHLRNGAYALIEVKLGGDDIDTAAGHLLALKNKIDTSRMKAPAFLMVITGTAYGFQREDGVYVIPAACLRE